jgi:bifunctional non-homologous end joining protein LigD
VKDFSQAVVQHLAGALPSLFVAKSGPKNRIKRIFVDYLRNGFGATTACAFSARARPGLGVSVPIAWTDLKKLTSSAQWSAAAPDQIFQASKKKPWKAIAGTQLLDEAADRLGIELEAAAKPKLRRTR